MDALSIFGLALVIIFVIVILFGSLFTVSQTERALIERYSRFQRVTGRGLQFKVPLIDAVRRINTQLQQFETQVETKTKDNVFVTIFVSIQLYVMEDTEDHIRNAYYKLYNPGVQIQSYVANAILGHVPSWISTRCSPARSPLPTSSKLRSTARWSSLAVACRRCR